MLSTDCATLGNPPITDATSTLPDPESDKPGTTNPTYLLYCYYYSLFITEVVELKSWTRRANLHSIQLAPEQLGRNGNTLAHSYHADIM